jgi:hypothetical protein
MRRADTTCKHAGAPCKRTSGLGCFFGSYTPLAESVRAAVTCVFMVRFRDLLWAWRRMARLPEHELESC